MKKYFGLWSILAIAFIVFFLYSFVGSKSLFGFELKSSKLSQSVIVQVDSLSVLNADTDSIMENVNIKSVFPQPVDTSSQTILFIGDSMLDGLSPRLAAYAKRSGHSLYSVIWYSSNTEQWGKSHRLTEYICKLHPSYIFICLGANELFVKDIKEKRTGYVKSILNEIDTIPSFLLVVRLKTPSSFVVVPEIKLESADNERTVAPTMGLLSVSKTFPLMFCP